jgi:hypothetical protein
MSGTSTPSFRLSSTTMRVLPPSRQKAFSCSSAQMRELERKENKTYRLAAASECQYEQSCASVFASLRIADYRSGAVIDLGLFCGCGNDHGSRLRGLVSTKLAHETFYGLIAATEPALRHQVLPDRHGTATLAQTQLDHLTKRFAQTDGLNGPGRFMFLVAQLHAKPGGHRILVGRFCSSCFCFSLRGKVFGVAVGVGVDRVGRFCRVDPVVTPFSLAGFAGGRRPQPPGGRTPIPAAFR